MFPGAQENKFPLLERKEANCCCVVVLALLLIDADCFVLHVAYEQSSGLLSCLRCLLHRVVNLAFAKHPNQFLDFQP